MCENSIGFDPPGTERKVIFIPMEALPIPENPVNYSIGEMIEIAKNSKHGVVWHSDKGPVQITKKGKLEPL